MDKGLCKQAITKYLTGVLCVGLLVFLPAGTLAFYNGWLLMSVVCVPILLVGIMMLVKSPALLKKRLRAKEIQKEQDLVVKLSGLMFLIGFIVAGLNYRFGWHMLPKGVSLAAAAVFLAAYLLYAEVMRENAYLSRTIEVQEGQQVIDTGLYGIVRHPMYSATLLLFLSMPLILGSVHAFVIFLVYPFLIARRIRFEELLLAEELEGYRAYQEKVRYRLIPFIW